MATRRESTLMGGESKALGRERNEAAPVPGQQVDAREPGPLAVGLEQLGRLPRLDPAAAQLGEQLHEPEVALETPLAPAETLQADDADRPRPEAPLALEARGDGVGRELAQALELELPAHADEGGAAPRVQAQPPQVGRREARELLAPGRDAEPGRPDRRRRRAHDPALDRAR